MDGEDVRRARRRLHNRELLGLAQQILALMEEVQAFAAQRSGGPAPWPSD